MVVVKISTRGWIVTTENKYELIVLVLLRAGRSWKICFAFYFEELHLKFSPNSTFSKSGRVLSLQRAETVVSLLSTSNSTILYCVNVYFEVSQRLQKHPKCTK